MPGAPRSRSVTRRLAAALLGIAFAVAACGSAATPTPAPTPTPTPTPTPAPSPTPSPTPVDVAARFLASMLNPDASGAASVTGTVGFGAIQGVASGGVTFAGASSATILTFAIAGTSSTSETISTASRTFERKDVGPWVESDEPPNARASLRAQLAAFSSVQDLGLETKSGRQLHHLRPPDGKIDPAAFGLDDPAIADPAFTIDIYVEDDGTLAVLVVEGTWTQDLNGQPTPASMTLQYDFRDMGSPQTVLPPEEIWTTFTSTALGYSMAHPADWTVESTAGDDTYLVDDQPFVYVAPVALTGSPTLASFVAALKDSYRDQFGPPESTAAAMLDGVASTRLVYRFTSEAGQDLLLVDVAAVVGKTGWEVFILTAAGEGEDLDVELFDQFVSTFRFKS